MKSLFYLIVLSSIFSTQGFDNRCCEPGRVLLKRKTTCWEPAHNTTANITLTCPSWYKQKVNYTIDEEGTLQFNYYIEVMQENTVIKLKLGRYCIGEQTTLQDLKLERTESAMVYCVDDETEEVIGSDTKAYCMLVSAVFLALTAVVYTLLPEIRDLLGKSIINYCVSSSLAFTLFIIMNFMSYLDMTLCAMRGFFAYFFIVASFFWTNAISIQMILSMKRPFLYDRGWREFAWYALYAWGCAGALTICLIIANYMPGDHKRPGFGLMTCWFYDNHYMYYLYSVMAVIIIVNIVIFSWCLYHLWSQRFHSSHVKAVRYKCMLSLRLFILMGIPWVCDMISSQTESQIAGAILDIFTTLQGLLTFVVLVLLRQRALKAMLKHGWLCCLSTSVEKHLALVEDVEDIAEHTVDYRLDDHKDNGTTNGVAS